MSKYFRTLSLKNDSIDMTIPLEEECMYCSNNRFMKLKIDKDCVCKGTEIVLTQTGSELLSFIKAYKDSE